MTGRIELPSGLKGFFDVLFRFVSRNFSLKPLGSWVSSKPDVLFSRELVAASTCVFKTKLLREL